MDEWCNEFDYSKNAVFHLVGKAFCLRGGAEQRTLKLSQFQRQEDSYVYHETLLRTKTIVSNSYTSGRR